jgi:hypothetical protein
MSQGRGRVDLDVDGYTLSLHGVLYAPQLRFNMLSTEREFHWIQQYFKRSLQRRGQQRDR